MTPTLLALSACAVTLVLSLLLPPAVKPFLRAWGIMDVPNERSSHERPIIRGVGLAVLISMVMGFAVTLTIGALSENALLGSAGFATLLVVALAATASGVLGLSEDLRGVSVTRRSVLLLGIAGVTAIVLVNPDLIVPPATVGDAATLDWGSSISQMSLPWWLRGLLGIYAVLFVSSYINVANFMDGLNGISGFHGVIAGLTFAAIGQATGLTWLAVAGLILAAGFLGFLPYNLTKPGAFLGDVGSYLLGGATAVTSFAALMAGVPLLATIGPMVIYFGDVGVTLVRRLRQGYTWHEPHKEHVYQKIQQLGYSHVFASAVAALCTGVTSALGFASLYAPQTGQIGLLLSGILVLVFYLFLPRILPSRPA